jgi:hypothetical protein
MILVNDPYDLVPELFKSFPEFSKSTESAYVDVLPPAMPESFEYSTRLTIFIQPEPDIHWADVAYQRQIIAKPNAVWVVSGFSNSQSWQLKHWILYWANLTSTVRSNPSIPSVELGHKPWLATALLGGWSLNRGLLMHEIMARGLLEKCLVNYYDRSSATDAERKQWKSRWPDRFFNYRTPQLDQLDDTVFLKIAFDRLNNTANTCRLQPGYRSGSHAWVSQLIPRNIYNSAYISIVAETETMVAPDTFFISEKITRPLLVGHPFVVFGCTGYLQCLRDLGFQTFSPWLDETYDLVTDTEKRIAAIVDSVEQFSQLNDFQRQQACAKMQPAVEHNRQLVKNRQWTFGPIANAIKQYLNLKPA